MSSQALGLIELLLVLGLVLGWGVREWWSVRRSAWPEDETRPPHGGAPAAQDTAADDPAHDGVTAAQPEASPPSPRAPAGRAGDAGEPPMRH